MRQLTLRVDDGLAVALRRAAAARSQSVNAFAATVLNAAVDPTFAADEAAELRERLSRAGILADAPVDGQRPARAALARARRRAGKGRSLASLVVEGRR